MICSDSDCKFEEGLDKCAKCVEYELFLMIHSIPESEFQILFNASDHSNSNSDDIYTAITKILIDGAKRMKKSLPETIRRIKSEGTLGSILENELKKNRR